MKGHEKMRDVVDLHTHTIASGHAYNTIQEMVRAARERNLEIYGITEHAPAMPGTCTSMYFQNLEVMPREREGMTVLFGAELNILDFDGHVDLPERVLAKLDFAIASMHSPCFQSGSLQENTTAYRKVMENPLISIIGHPDDGRYPVDYDVLAKEAARNQVILEMNNSSLAPGSYRENAAKNYRIMLAACKKYRTPVIIDSDAHVDLDVGNHSLALQLLGEVDFPEELLINAHPELLKKYLNYYRNNYK